MARNDDIFIFGSSPGIPDRDDLVMRVPVTISDFSHLLAAYRGQLELPGYVGHNWNALSECLRDLSWVKQRRVVILHDELPRLSAIDLTEYLDVLRECVLDWKPGEEHELIVLFPVHCRDGVLAFLKARS